MCFNIFLILLKIKGDLKMYEIIPSFKETIFNENTIEVFTDMGEVCVDTLLEEGIVKSIPLLNVVYNLAQVGLQLRERKFIRHTQAFIEGFNKGELSKEKIRDYCESLDNDSKKAEKELGRIIFVLDRNIEEEKSKILGLLFKSYISKKIDWIQFCELVEVTDKLFIRDIKILLEFYKNNISYDFNNDENYRFARLSSIGLVTIQKAKDYVENETLVYNLNQDIKLTSIGEKYCTIINTISD